MRIRGTVMKMRPLLLLFLLKTFFILPTLSWAITLTEISTGFSAPTFITNSGDGSGRLFVGEKNGVVKVLKDGVVNQLPFLDIQSRVSTSSERGLLSLAFHPKYRTNRKFYVYYTDLNGDITISQYRMLSANGDRADPSSGRVLLRIPHRSFDNHNGGQLQFGPDGYLYIGTGDGGGGGDPLRSGQNRRTLLGKILRIDIDRGARYAIPSSNPYASSSTTRREIFAIGFRNPWRFSFDRSTNRFFVADVGQNAREEINIVTRKKNYGWNTMEGTLCYPSSGCDQKGLSLPIFEYAHDEEGGESITGGYVYRGHNVSSLIGKYVYADFISGRIWALNRNSGGSWVSTLLLDTELNISSFGVDERRELYVCDYSSGTVYRIDS